MSQKESSSQSACPAACRSAYDALTGGVTARHRFVEESKRRGINRTEIVILFCLARSDLFEIAIWKRSLTQGRGYKTAAAADLAHRPAPSAQ